MGSLAWRLFCSDFSFQFLIDSWLLCRCCGRLGARIDDGLIVRVRDNAAMIRWFVIQKRCCKSMISNWNLHEMDIHIVWRMFDDFNLR